MVKRKMVLGIVIGLFYITLPVVSALAAPIVLRHSDINSTQAPQGIFAKVQ